MLIREPRSEPTNGMHIQPAIPAQLHLSTVTPLTQGAFDLSVCRLHLTAFVSRTRRKFVEGFRVPIGPNPSMTESERGGASPYTPGSYMLFPACSAPICPVVRHPDSVTVLPMCRERP
jgi:hypothetical protein